MGSQVEPSQILVLELRPDFTENLEGQGSPGQLGYRTLEAPVTYSVLEGVAGQGDGNH